MDTSKLGSLGLSAQELGSVVNHVVSKSTPYYDFILKYPLVGGGNVTRPLTCGKFSHRRGCTDVETHASVGYSGVFVRKIHMSCGNLRCPICARVSWATKESRKVAARLNVTSERLGLPFEHLSVSFDPKTYGIGDEKVYRKMGLEALRELGVDDGFYLFHGSRHRRFTGINGEPTGELNGFRQFGTDWSPHAHELGFVKGGYTCRECPRKSNCSPECSGFDSRRWKYYKKTGIYVKVIIKDEHKYEERRNAKWTSWYQLHHASIEKDAKRAHVGVWHGACSYRNMGKVKVTKEASICPICKLAGKEKVMPIVIYTGKKNFILNRYDPNYEKDTMEELYEDGVQVYYEMPESKRGKPVKHAFNINFEGGKHEQKR